MFAIHLRNSGSNPGFMEEMSRILTSLPWLVLLTLAVVK